MAIIIEQRRSDSPFIERIYRSRSENINSFISIAAFHLDLVFWTEQGETGVALRGPETRASRAPVPANAEFFGIVFRPGVFMPHLPTSNLTDDSAMLPTANCKSFWLKSDVWQIPTFDNAETFVDHLVHDEILTHEPVVESILMGELPDMSMRSIQRRFQYAAGINYRTMQQIERARRATILLQQGVSILDTVHKTGYFDQAHMTKYLKYYIGQTPGQLIDTEKSEQLSLLYKTSTFC